MSKICEGTKYAYGWLVRHRRYCRNSYRSKQPAYALANKKGYIKVTYFTDEIALKKELAACNAVGKG
jgi:hypothetical protein